MDGSTMYQANMFIAILMFKNAGWKCDSKKNSNIDGLIFYKQIIGLIISKQILTFLCSKIYSCFQTES